MKIPQSCAFGLAGLMAIAPTILPFSQAAASPLEEDSEMPLELTLGELDSSWRQMNISGLYDQYEFAAPFLSILSLVGLSNVWNNNYFTQGKTTEIAGQEYLVAYRFPTASQELDLENLFSVWDSNQECDTLGALESQFITRESKVQLSLLNPVTMGSLNDIQSLNVDAVIQQAEERLAKLKVRCEEAQAKEKVSEAVRTLDDMHWAQETLWINESRFTDDVTELGVSPTNEDLYSYVLTLDSPTLVTSKAIATSETGYHIVGGVYMVDDSDPTFPFIRTVLCESEEPGGDVPPAPTFNQQSEFFTCPAGTFETY